MLPALQHLVLTFLGAVQIHIYLCMNVPAGKVCGQKQFCTYGQVQTCEDLFWVKIPPCLPHQVLPLVERGGLSSTFHWL